MSQGVEVNDTRNGLQEAALDAIVVAEFVPDDFEPDALAPAEEFHTFGQAATWPCRSGVDHCERPGDRRR